MGSLPNTPPSAEVLCQIVTPVGMLGYGLVEDEMYRGLELARQNHPGVPTAIIMDSGSTDSGPSKLALGSMTCPERSYARDLRSCLRAARAYGVPVLLSSAGGDGEDTHVKLFAKIVDDIAKEETAATGSADHDDAAVKLKVLSIYSTLDKALVLDRLVAGDITGCGPCVPSLTAEAVQATTAIVGQMGPEPFVQAMAAHPDFDVVLGGRSYDPSPYVAFSAYCYFKSVGANPATADVLSIDTSVLGGFTHMGKIMECGGLCATPKSKGTMATIYRDGSFDITPLAVGAVCQPLTVAAHTLYEKSRPDKLAGPGGDLNLTMATYRQLPDNVSVHTHGATFAPSWGDSGSMTGAAYTVKLEGARQTGFRTIFMGSFCDPILLAQLPVYLEQVKAYVASQNQDLDTGSWQLDFHVYDGKDHEGTDTGRPDVVEGATNIGTPPAGVVFIVGEALASTQELATGLASAARIGCVHGPYKGQKANSGNFGMGIGGVGEIEMGACAEFSVYHLMNLARGEEGSVEEGSGVVVQSEASKNTSVAAVPHDRGTPLFRWEMTWAGEGNSKRVSELPFRPSVERAALVNTVAVNGGKKTVNGSELGNGTAATKGATTTTTTTKTAPQKTTLGSIAKILRSKNSGPYEITMDVLFDDEQVYKKIKASGVLTADRVAALYGIAVDQLVYCGFFDQALAFKATLPRMRHGQPVASGGYMENDVHGSQKYKPLMNVEVDL